jgi:hypothetical protein
MEKESLALLLTVIADIDAGFDLFRNDPLQGGMTGLLDFGRVDGFATRAPGIEPRQPGRTREASGMRRENTVVTASHGYSGSSYRLARQPRRRDGQD